MVVGTAFCPHPPVLIPQLSRGAAGELDELRGACRAAIAAAVPPGCRPVLIGAGAVSRQHPPGTRGTLAGFGADLEVVLGAGAASGDPVLPLSLTVGAWLVQDALGPDTAAVGIEVGRDGALALPDGELGLVVMGDGTARRSTAAPGYLDERAEAYDAGIAAALASGDGAELSGLDAGLGAQLLAAGVPTWRAVGPLVGAGWHVTVRYADAPYGVGYFAADWTPDG
jgi:hypothetical protein